MICSKSDDILPEHDWAQFNVEKEHSNWRRAERSLDKWKLNNGETLDELHTEAEALAELANEVTIRLDKWDVHLENLQNCRKVKMPKTALRKRKAVPRRSRPSKKSKVQLTLMEVFHHDADTDPNADHGPASNL